MTCILWDRPWIRLPVSNHPALHRWASPLVTTPTFRVTAAGAAHVLSALDYRLEKDGKHWKGCGVSSETNTHTWGEWLAESGCLLLHLLSSALIRWRLQRGNTEEELAHGWAARAHVCVFACTADHQFTQTECSCILNWQWSGRSSGELRTRSVPLESSSLVSQTHKLPRMQHNPFLDPRAVWWISICFVSFCNEGSLQAQAEITVMACSCEHDIPVAQGRTFFKFTHKSQTSSRTQRGHDPTFHCDLWTVQNKPTREHSEKVNLRQGSVSQVFIVKISVTLSLIGSAPTVLVLHGYISVFSRQTGS